MRNFGSTLSHEEIVDAVTCQVDTPAQTNSYDVMLPATKKINVVQSRLSYYDTVENRWTFETQRKKLDGSFTDPTPGLTRSGSVINRYFKDMYTYSGGPVNGNLIYNPVSFWVYNSITKKRVHPDLLPYYQGDTYNWTVKGLMEADVARAMSIRSRMIKDYSVELAKKGLDAYASAMSSGSSGQTTTELQEIATNVALQEIETNATNTTGGNEENESSDDSGMLPKVLTTLVFAGIGLGIAHWRSKNV